jgi:outer membrane cobalamin receptor
MFAQISHAFKFGFEFNLEAKYQGATQDYDSIEQRLIDLDEFTVFNIRVSQQVFKQNEIFLRINNITDDFRLKSWGNPIKGRNFIAGINLHF